MSPRRIAIALAAAACLLTAGCTYDYLQRGDAVGYDHGNAVRANIEAQTEDPSNDAMYDTSGLGKNGAVITAGDDATDP